MASPPPSGPPTAAFDEDSDGGCSAMAGTGDGVPRGMSEDRAGELEAAACRAAWTAAMVDAADKPVMAVFESGCIPFFFSCEIVFFLGKLGKDFM